MIYNGRTTVRVVPVYYTADEIEGEGCGEGDDILVYGFTYYTTMKLERDVHVMADLKWREYRVTVLHKAIK